ncbi:Crp/Fnr family transcriptional regulator [Aureimonas leprariae]|uniref:Crp/Fnr family transcriptional regulator n=1 Tax=Plantimonas leprariae TaxID=2615207 RepID=A0A7V7PPQ2_9HYPH|nr:Crp/Fnr family transcriptional regulator [Aureimonas leprariae]KAB0680048.1 Crp/Fnr family transcriptional regulator [Aureimonas leprariae]
MGSDNEALDVLLRRLSSASELSDKDRDILAGLDFDYRSFPPRARIAEMGDTPTLCFVVLDGVTSRYQLTRDGEYQIHAIQIRGELPDLCSLHLGEMDHSIRTLSECRLAFVEHASLFDACNRSPTINAAFWRETLIDAAIYRASNLRIGKLSAVARLAHLICEMTLRFDAVGAVRDGRYTLDMTQQEIGDLLALSFVSVNRALRTLREEGLAGMERRTVEILDWDRLVERGMFDPVYLHMNA